jgi:hypothetical protein
MPTIQEGELLIDNVLFQAKTFLADAGEFFPFGSVIDRDGNLKPVGIYFGDDHPQSTEVLERIEQAIIDGLKKHDYRIAAIGLDVAINTRINTVLERKDAVEIRIYELDTPQHKKFYYTYEKNESGYTLIEHKLNS